MRAVIRQPGAFVPLHVRADRRGLQHVPAIGNRVVSVELVLVPFQEVRGAGPTIVRPHDVRAALHFLVGKPERHVLLRGPGIGVGVVPIETGRVVAFGDVDVARPIGRRGSAFARLLVLSAIRYRRTWLPRVGGRVVAVDLARLAALARVGGPVFAVGREPSAVFDREPGQTGRHGRGCAPAGRPRRPDRARPGYHVVARLHVVWEIGAAADRPSAAGIKRAGREAIRARVGVGAEPDDVQQPLVRAACRRVIQPHVCSERRRGVAVVVPRRTRENNRPERVDSDRRGDGGHADVPDPHHQVAAYPVVAGLLVERKQGRATDAEPASRQRDPVVETDGLVRARLVVGHEHAVLVLAADSHPHPVGLGPAAGVVHPARGNHQAA